MFKRARHCLAVAACSIVTVAGLAGGVIASCDGNYCDPNMFGCTPLNQPFQDSCCRPTSTGYRCFSCWRDHYWCYNSMYGGPAYNCSGAGAYCS